MTDLTPIFNALIALVAALTTAFVIPWIRRNTTQKDREGLLKWAEIGVSAAQQLYHQKDGKIRKEYVLQFLYEKGYDIDSLEVEYAIEAAVLKLHQELEGKA